MRRESENKVINIFCSHYLPHIGGVERFVMYQLREFKKRGYYINIITSNTENGKFKQKGDHYSVYRLSSVSLLKNGRLPLPINLIQIVEIFIRCLITRKNINIVHTRFFPIVLLGSIFSRIAFSQLFLIDHSSGYVTLGSKKLDKISIIYDHIFTFILKLFRPKVLGVSLATNTWLENFNIKACGVYYNGIDYKNSINLSRLTDNENKYIFYGGRLIPEKGVLKLVDGFKRFSEECTNAEYKLFIAGSGPLEDSLKRIKEGNVVFLGQLDQKTMFKYMSNATIFVNASNYPEGLPTVILEAGIFGIPVISTPNGGSKEVIINNKTGILIPKGTAREISSAIWRLHKNKELRERLGHNLQKKVRNEFDWGNITQNFINNYL